jgi:hypothetical protein
MLALTLFCSGCGAGDALQRCEISGKVTLAGSQLDAGSIQFMPRDAQSGPGLSGGASIEQGEYSIPRQRGLPPGIYKVMIFAAGSKPAAQAMPGELAAPMEERIPPEFNVNSEQTVTVVHGERNAFDFDIP